MKPARPELRRINGTLTSVAAAHIAQSRLAQCTGGARRSASE